MPSGNVDYEALALAKNALGRFMPQAVGASGATWGVDGSNLVRPISDVYMLDSFTGRYHKVIASSEYSPLNPSIGLEPGVGYDFAAIPS